MMQRTEEWYEMRVGMFTASQISNLLMKPETAGYRNYISEKVAERLTGQDASSDYESTDMKRGTELEPQARILYEIVTGVTVMETGLVIHTEIPCLGASPDGLVSDVGLIEIKCRNIANHIDIILTGKIDRNAILQMQCQMMCCKREWCDYINYHPGLPAELQLHIIRVKADPEIQESIKQAVQKADKEVEGIIAKLTEDL